jgi:hypothetical protein
MALAFEAQGQLRLSTELSRVPESRDPPPAPAQGRESATGEAAQPYVDRVIGGDLAPEPDPAELRTYRREGWPRFLRIDTRLGTDPFNNDRYDAGLVASGGIETPNHGVVSFDATLFPSDGNSVVTVRQRALPVTGGWMVNNEAGVLAPLLLNVMRSNTRVFVPTVLTRGAQTEWLGSDGLNWHASSGELGVLTGYPVQGFRTLAGTVSTLGVEGRAGAWSMGARQAYANDISNAFESDGRRFTTHSTHLAARTDSDSGALQGQAIAAQREGGETRYGAWVDGEHRIGRSTYGWGFYRLDPNLTWAGQPMASDAEGAYARGAWHTRQASGSASIDVLRSVSGDEDTGVLLTATGQWRYSRSLTLSAGATVREYTTDGYSLFGDMRWLHDYGRTGVRAEFNDYTGQERVSRLVLDHDWPVPQGWSFATSLWGGRERSRERDGSLWGGAATLTMPLASQASFIANGNFERRAGGESYGSANVSLAWQLSPRWSIEGNAQYSYGDLRIFVPLDPLAPPERVQVKQENRSLYLILRYEDRAGTRAIPLGGAALSGGGRITGRVFLDANANGTMEASEQGAAGVTVYLDGRFSARTDAQGRFEFPFVASGHHAVTVLNETLPLPWELPERAEHRLEVRVREVTEILVPVIRRN